MTPSLWILGCRRDLLLFVATPIVLLPLLFVVRTPGSIETVAMYVAAFGATGHHLPGMLRAYGDRALFRRFRVRFVLAPLFLLAVCTGCSFADIYAPLTILLFWSVWHGLAQLYGFARIYDGKARSVDPVTARFDLLLLVFWFVSVLLSSDQTRERFAGRYYESGAPLLTVGTFELFSTIWMWGTAAFTAAYVVRSAARWRAGAPPSPVKLLALAIGIGFFWFTYGTMTSLFLGIALFEIAHDVQYLAIVWIYNRKRAETSESAGSFTRFLFRNSWSLVGLYVGLVFAYGAIALIDSPQQNDWISKALVGMLTASALLHFYYDGFIWKVREQETGSNLGLAGRAPAAGSGPITAASLLKLPGWLRHGLKWSVFAALIAVGVWFQQEGPPSLLSRYQNLGELAPTSWRVQNELGPQDIAAGDHISGMAAYEKATTLAPDEPSISYNRGVALQALREYERADAQYVRALELRPDYEAVHFRLGTLRARQGRADAAMAEFAQVEPLIGRVAQAANGYCVSLVMIGREQDALDMLRKSLETWPDDVDLNFNAMLLERRAGNNAAARATLMKLRGLAPDSADICIYQAWLLAAQPQTPEDPNVAILFAERARDLRRGVPDPLLGYTLGIAYASARRFPEAIASATEALATSAAGLNLPPGTDPERTREVMQEHLELYRAGRPYRAPEETRDFGLLPQAFRE